MSQIQDLESSIEQDRQRALAAGLTVPEIPRTPSYGNRYSDLDSFRRWTLDPLLRRIGSAPMQKPRLTPSQAKDFGGTLRTGFRFSFPQYPGVEWFVYNDGRFWRAAEYKTGMAAGVGVQNTRTAAIAAQWDILENMRTAKNHGGSPQSVIAFVQKCIAEKHTINE